MKIFVTGGSGYIGSVLVLKLIKQGHSVSVLTSKLFNSRGLDLIADKCNIIIGDLRDTQLLQEHLKGIDAVIHLAAISNDSCADLNPELAYEINYTATKNLVELAKKNNVKRFIYASSSGVYGIKKEKEVTENLSLNPETVYSKSKALGERAVLDANDENFTTVAIRAAATAGYSPRMCLDLTVNILTHHAINKGKITVFGGEQKRPIIHIDDITDYYTNLLDIEKEKIAGQVFNAGAENLTVLEIANIVREIIGTHIEIEKKESDNSGSYHINSEKIKNVLGFSPKKTVRDAVLDLKSAFEKGLIPNPDDPYYKKVEIMKELSSKKIKIVIDNNRLQYQPKRVAEWVEKGDCFPIFVEISPTNRCNHNCAFCAVDWLERGGYDIDTNLMINALKDMAENGVKSLMWAGEGEPFLHKDMALFLKKAHEFGMENSLATNAVLFTKEKIEQSIPYLSWIRFSVDSGSPEIYAEIHGTKPEDFYKAINNLKEAVKFRNEKNLKTVLGVQLVMIPPNMKEVTKLATILKEIGVDNFQLKPYSHHPGSLNDFSLKIEDHDKIKEDLQKFESGNLQILFREDSVQRTFTERPYKECHGIPFFALIDCRGNVIPCSHFYKNKEFFFGNLHEQTFSEIWKSDRKKQVLKKIHEIGTKACRTGCRLDIINRYLDRIKHPYLHDNFL